MIKKTELDIWSDIERAIKGGRFEEHINIVWVSLESLKKEIDEEIDYLENHVLLANKGIKINVERVQSWIFEAKKIRNLLCNSSEQNESDNRKGVNINSVSGEHNTGEDKVLDASTTSSTESSPIHINKKCTCESPFPIFHDDIEKDFCGRCGVNYEEL